MNRVPKLFAIVCFGVFYLALTSRGAHAARLFIDQQFNVSMQQNVTYATKPIRNGSVTVNTDLKLDIYRPTGSNVPAQLPAIVLMHGGYFVDGSKTSSPMVPMAFQFASRGYVAVSIDYRKLLNNPPAPGDLPTVTPERIPDWLFPDLLNPLGKTLDDYVTTIAAATSDQASAVNWLRANADTYGINPAWISAGGFSAGAVSSLLLAAGAIDGANAEVNAAFSMAGGMFGLESFITPGDPGVFILHGTNDDTVPFSEVGYLQNALSAAGVPFALQILPGGGHSSSGLNNAIATNPDPLFEFMAARLVPEPASCVLAAIAAFTLISVGRKRFHSSAR